MSNITCMQSELYSVFRSAQMTLCVMPLRNFPPYIWPYVNSCGPTFGLSIQHIFVSNKLTYSVQSVFDLNANDATKFCLIFFLYKNKKYIQKPYTFITCDSNAQFNQESIANFNSFRMKNSRLKFSCWEDKETQTNTLNTEWTFDPPPPKVTLTLDSEALKYTGAHVNMLTSI